MTAKKTIAANRWIWLLALWTTQVFVSTALLLAGGSSERSPGESESAPRAHEGVLPPGPAPEPDLSAFPVTIDSCGYITTYESPPERVVVNDVNIIEIFLELGLADRLVAYSSVRENKRVHERYEPLLEDLPLLGDRYPSLEVLLGADPDFYFAGWNYGIREDAGITPPVLEQFGVNSYAITESCIRIMERDNVTIEDTYNDFINIGKIFGVEEHARQIVDDFRARIDAVTEIIKENVEEPIPVFVYDSGEETPLTAGGYAMPNALIELAGGVNIARDVGSSWTRIGWEEVVDRNAKFIVIIDYGEPDAQGKIDFLKSVPALANTDAIVNDNFVVLGYNEATPGPRNIDSVERMAAAFYPELFPVETNE